MVYVFLANGFEESEAICPINLMRRAGITVTTVSLNSDPVVTGTLGTPVIADTVIGKLSLEADIEKGEPEMLFLPGGMPGATNLGVNKTVAKYLTYANENGKLIGAICAAPKVLGKYEILAGREAICYPGYESQLEGAVISKKTFVRDGNIITANGVGSVIEFGLLLVEALRGREAAEKVRKTVLA